MGIVNKTDRELLFRKDPIFQTIHDQYGPPPEMYRDPGFTSLCKIILEQQVSLASARAHFQRLHDYVPKFEPTYLLKLTDAEMRECQISRQKTVYLRALSQALLDGSLDLQKLEKDTTETVREKLIRIKGIGVWTTEVYLMFCLGRKDIFPLGDIALVRTMRELTEAKTKETMATYIERWQPLRSLAAFYLWHYYLKKRNRPFIP